MINNILTDLTNHTKGLDFEYIRVITDDKETKFVSALPGYTMMFEATTKKPIEDFKGTFGLGNIGILRGYIDIYGSGDQQAAIKMHRNDRDIPTEFSFEAAGQSKSTYRLVSEMACPKFPSMSMVPQWQAVINQIDKSKVQEFSRFSNILSKVEKKFTVKTEDGNLVFGVGNSSMASASVKIGEVPGVLKSEFSYDITSFLTVVGYGTADIMFSDKGFARVTIESDVATYHYTFNGNN